MIKNIKIPKCNFERTQDSNLAKILIFPNSMDEMELDYIRYNGDEKREQALSYGKTTDEYNELNGIMFDAYLHFVGIGNKQDDKKAFELLEKAARLGFPPAQFRLGICYENLVGVEQNCKEALRWYNMASLNGYTQAYNYLGIYYELGIATYKNKEKAKENYMQAADWGDRNAMYHVAQILFKEDDEYYSELAFRYYKLAAQWGNTEAQTMVGLMYDKGIGVEQDLVESLEWFQEAADNNDPNALFYLGVKYLTGEFVEQDRRHGYELLKKARDLGNDEAWNLLDTWKFGDD